MTMSATANAVSVAMVTSNALFGALQVTAAHEYFHLVQFGYDINEDGWIMESTATWAEDEVFDSINDNAQYLREGLYGLATSVALRMIVERERERHERQRAGSRPGGNAPGSPTPSAILESVRRTAARIRRAGMAGGRP